MGEQQSIPAWRDSTLNVLIPMAGAGSRFVNAGYTFPKPLIDVKGKPMIQLVIENLNIKANYVYVVQKEHRKKYNLDTLLNLITPGCKIVETEGVTEGAACTALLAKEYIDSKDNTYGVNSYDESITYGSGEEKYHYICPRFWCIRDDDGKSRSLSLEQVNSGECGGWDSVIPENAKRVPKGNAYVSIFHS